jgi:GDSL-like Lipase/Acylhydrolase family
MTRRARRLLVKLALVLVSLLLSLAAAEVALRVLWTKGHPSLRSALDGTPNVYAFYQFDPRLGWSNKPSSSGVFQRAEFTYPIRINRHGMRYHEVDPAPAAGTVRIAFLGDSFVWGVGAADRERVTDLLEKQYGIEALNFGASGYSPTVYDLMLDRVIEFHPRYVVIGFCLGNDFSDNVMGFKYGRHKPYYELSSGGDLELKGYPVKKTLATVPKFRDFDEWAPHSLLFRLIKKEAIDFEMRRFEKHSRIGRFAAFDDAMIYDPEKYPSPEARRMVGEAIVVNRKILQRIRARLAERKMSLVVLTVPTKLEYPTNGPTNRRALAALYESLAGLDIPVIDVVDRLNLKDFWEADGHWRPEGHRKVADAVSEWLTREGIVKR